MDERWTYFVLSDPDKQPTGLRIVLEDRQSQKRATIQLAASGDQTELDQEPHDYECMEWKAKEILDSARGDGRGDEVLGAVKEHLRSALGG
jgi:hypothetical protein